LRQRTLKVEKEPPRYLNGVFCVSPMLVDDAANVLGYAGQRNLFFGHVLNDKRFVNFCA